MAKKLDDIIKKESDRAAKRGISVESGKGNDSNIKSVIPTGISQLDDLLKGGFTRGHIIELAGEQSSGKTTIISQFISNAQRLVNAKTVFMDIEKKWDPTYAETLGVDGSKVDIVRSDELDAAINILVNILKNKIADIVVIDSILGALTHRELNKKDGVDEESRMAGLATTMGIASKLVPHYIDNAIVIFVNRLKDNITNMGSYGSRVPGGKDYGCMLNEQIWMVRRHKHKLPTPVKFRIAKAKIGGVLEGSEVDVTLGEGVGFIGDFDANELFKNVDSEMSVRKLKDGSIKIGNKYKYSASALCAMDQDELKELIKIKDWDTIQALVDAE